MIPSSEEIMFESSSGSKVITISEDTPFDVLRKIINDAIRGYRILLYFFIVNQFTLVMVALNASVWSLNATMM